MVALASVLVALIVNSLTNPGTNSFIKNALNTFLDSPIEILELDNIDTMI